MPEWILDMNKAINQVVWGVPMLLLLVGTGIYLSFLLHFLQITRIKEWCGETFGSFFSKQKRSAGGGISPYQAVSAALASSVGTGSVVGVALAIISGGPGAVFWMWVSAFFGMITKYAEIVLAVRFRGRDKDGVFYGGPMYYIEKGIGASWKWLAVLFAIFAALACPGMGGMSQSNTIAGILYHDIRLPTWVTGTLLTAITATAVSGGIKRISGFAEKVVPFMAIFYVVGGLIVMLIDVGATLRAFREIFACALSPSAIYGGSAGYMVSRAMRFGVARGVFSNEAGLGSAPIVHAAANVRTPISQGYWGMFEVFVDTFLICSITAVVVISSGLYTDTTQSGVALTSAAFSKGLGGYGGAFVSVATILFSLATILGWSYYGEQCMRYLARGSNIAVQLYRAIFIIAVGIGAISRVDAVWEAADTLNGLMALPNLIAVLVLSGTVADITKKSL